MPDNESHSQPAAEFATDPSGQILKAPDGPSEDPPRLCMSTEHADRDEEAPEATHLDVPVVGGFYAKLNNRLDCCDEHYDKAEEAGILARP